MFKYYSIAQFHQNLLSGTASCVEAVQHYLQQIDARRHLNAYVQTYAEEALQRAAALDANRKAGKPTGKLHGVVIALKDVIAYKDHPLSEA